MYNLHLSAEQLEIRDTVRDFVAQEIKPWAIKSERLEALDRTLPLDLLDKASQLGLRTLALSEELGGAGADNLTACIVAEELAAGDPDIATVLGETSRLAHLLFDRAMTAEQRDRFLPAFLADDRFHLALADEEPDDDDGLGINYHRPVTIERAVKATATRSKTDWIINGAKDCVANAPLAKLFAVTVRTDSAQDVATILVPHDAPGVIVHSHDDGQRWFHGACGEVVFENCRVPAENILSGTFGADQEDGRGVPLAQAVNLGIGRAAYEAALDYAQLRVQGGRPIVEHQAIGVKLAEVAIRLEVARNTVWQAAWASDHPDAFADRSLANLPLTTLAKAFCSEAIYHATKDAAECFGAMGVMRDMPLHKHVHDALICVHAGGRNSDAKLAIAEALAGYRRFPAASARAAE
jgi:alkylation response protein AidB-like acyl-CoA dehydrogenase